MAVIIVLLIGFIYRISVSNQQLAANDLKYRYIKMKGEATSKRIAELEEIFELNRDNAKIRQMKKDVEEYEQTIQRKVQLEEQARLKEREAERLNKNASRLKNKYAPPPPKVLPSKEIRKVMQVAPQILRIFLPAVSADRYQRK